MQVPGDSAEATPIKVLIAMPWSHLSTPRILVAGGVQPSLAAHSRVSDHGVRRLIRSITFLKVEPGESSSSL